MTALDDKIVPKVNAVLTKVGISGTITESAGTFTPSTGAVSGGGTVHSGVTFSPPAPYRKVLVGDQYLAGDAVSYVKGPTALGFTPKIGWRAAVGGVDYLIVGVSDLRSGDSIAAFELQLRR